MVGLVRHLSQCSPFPSYQPQHIAQSPTYTHCTKSLYGLKQAYSPLCSVGPLPLTNHISGVPGNPTPHQSHSSYLSHRVSNPANFGTLINPAMVKAKATLFSSSNTLPTIGNHNTLQSSGQSQLPGDSIVLNSRANLLYEQGNVEGKSGTTQQNTESPTSLPVTQIETANSAEHKRHGELTTQHDPELFQFLRDHNQPLPFFIHLHNQAHSHSTPGG